MIKRKAVLFLAAALVAAGCNLNAQPPRVVTVTEESTELPQTTSSPVPSATIMPTPTVEPAITLHQGDGALLNGRFEEAAAAYTTLVAQAGAPPEDRATAAFGLGQSALREGMFAQAVAALTSFIEQFSQDSRIAQAHYLRGNADLGLSHWNDAITDFQIYLSLRPGLIDSYAEERIGDAQLALGQTDNAIASYTQAASDPGRGMALQARAAQVMASTGRSADALAQYDAILKIATSEPYRAQIAFQAAQVAVASGDMQNGLVRMMQVFNNYPDQPEAYEAMNILLKNNVELDNMARGQVAYNYGDYQGAIDALNLFTEAHTVDQIPASLLLLLGQAYSQIGNVQAALTSFQTILDHYTTDPLFGAALLEQGQARALNNDSAGAIEQYMHIADVYDYLDQAPEALWRAGSLYSQTNQPEQARAVFERIADKYPTTIQAKAGLFVAAALAYNSGDLRAAERYYSELSVKTTGEDQAAAYFWVSKLALQNGDQKTAADALAQAVQAAPDSYFAARARDIVSNQAAFAAPKGLQFQFDEAAQIAQAEDWLRKTYNLAQTGSLAALAPELQADPRLLRGRELWDVSEAEAAIAEFDDLVDANKESALASYQLAVYFQSIGAYKDSVVAVSYVIRNANVGTLDAPPYIARLRYPAYYLDLVQTASAKDKLDPLLLLSVIRLESLFDTHATGSVGEKGLMQVASGVAQTIAAQLNWPNYQHSDLSQPYAGIEFGAASLAQQLQRFKDSVPAALVAYDVGTGRAQSWLDLSGGDPDQFMAAVDLDSARQYVQNVYSYYTIYRALYGTN